MSRVCELTGKAAQTGHKVSHSNHKTKRRVLPNLCNVTMMSDVLGRSVSLRVSANALRTVDHRGGLDAFLAKAKDGELSSRVLDLKRQIAKKSDTAKSDTAKSDTAKADTAKSDTAKSDTAKSDTAKAATA